MSDITNVKSIASLVLTRLVFSYEGWGKDKKLKGNATFNKSKEDEYSGTKNLEIQLDEDLSGKLMAVLSPLVVASASLAAQKLANEAKELAEGLGAKMLALSNDIKAIEQ